MIDITKQREECARIEDLAFVVSRDTVRALVAQHREALNEIERLRAAGERLLSLAKCDNTMNSPQWHWEPARGKRVHEAIVEAGRVFGGGQRLETKVTAAMFREGR